MALRDAKTRHIRLISFYQTRHTVRGGAGLVFLMITLLFGLSVAQAVLAPVEHLMAQQAKAGSKPDPEMIVNEVLKLGRPVIQWALGFESNENSPASREAWTMF